MSLNAEQVERIGPEDPEKARERGMAAFARSRDFLRDQSSRPLADKSYLQELTESSGDADDGRFLSQVIERLSDEVKALTMLRGHTRELALCLTKLDEAYQWAVAHGIKTNSHVIIDRRVFKVDPQETNQ